MRREKHLKGSLQDFCIGIAFGLLISWKLVWLVAVLNLLIGMDAFLFYRLGVRLEWSFLSFVKRYKDFHESTKDTQVQRWIPFFIGFFAFPFIIPQVSSNLIELGFVFFFGAITLLTLKQQKLSEHHLFFYYLSKLHIQKKTSLGHFDLSQIFFFENETSHFPDPAYPLYRYTKSFKGKKQWEMEIEKGEKPHIVFLILESFRTKDIGCLGGEYPITPHFDALAKEGILFSKFYSQSVFSSRGMVSSLFGIPYLLRTNDYLETQLPLIGIQHLLKNQGYQTNAFSGCSHLFRGEEAFFSSQGFDHQIDCRDLRSKHPEDQGLHWGMKDEYLVEAFIDHLEKHQDILQFYVLFTVTNHHPWILPHSFPSLPLPQTGTIHYDRFLQTMHYTDYCLGLLIQKLREKRLSKKTLLVVFGDHGMVFKNGRKNPLSSRALTKDELHVPLLFSYEGHVQKPRRISTPACQYDLVPTVMDLLDLQDFHHAVGNSLMRQLPERPLFFYNPFIDNCVGILKGKIKGSYIPRTNNFQIYDWDKDPLEEKPLSYSWPEGSKIAQCYLEIVKNLYEEKRFIPQKPYVETPVFYFQVPSSISRSDLMEIFMTESKIKILDLRRHPGVDDEMLMHIAKYHSELKTVYLDDCIKITDQGMENFLKSCRNLQNLSLSGCMLLTSKTYQNLTEYNQRLISLTISGTDLLVNLKDLSPLTSLGELVIDSSGLDEPIKRLFPNLFKLRISCLSFGIDRLKKMLEPLCLSLLKLLDCEILRDEDLEHLFSYPQAWDCLSELRLYKCHQLTDRSVETLRRLPIEKLFLFECPHLTKQGSQALSEIFPKFNIMGSQVDNTFSFFHLKN